MRAALGDFRVAGLSSNIGFLSRLVGCRSFAQADLDTALIERESPALFAPEAAPPETFFIAALAQILAERTGSHCDRNDGWRLNGFFARELTFRFGETQASVEATYLGGSFLLSLGEKSLRARGRLTEQGMTAEFDGRRIQAVVIAAGDARSVFWRGGSWKLEKVDPFAVTADGHAGHGGLRAPMPGRVISLLVEPGVAVEKGAPLLILEAMKMEHKLTAPAAGAVTAFFCAVDDQVSEGAELVDFEADT